MKRKGFTLTELLVVMAIIAMLIGILVPALVKSRVIAKNLQQKAQLRAIGLGVEQFSIENNNFYPNSSVMNYNTTDEVYGAHRLVTALMGRDLYGYAKDGNETPKKLYSAKFKEEDRDFYLDRDKYIFANPKQIYSQGTRVPDLAGDDFQTDIKEYYPVISDVFTQKNILVKNLNYETKKWEDEKIAFGTPILYWKANLNSEYLDPNHMDTSASFNPDWTQYRNWIYNIDDNYGFLKIASVKSYGESVEKFHKYKYDIDTLTATGRENFYTDITNFKLRTHLAPQNKDSFILMSAGADGIFGTADDIRNF